MTQQTQDPNRAGMDPQQGGERPQDGQQPQNGQPQGEERSFRQGEQRPGERPDDAQRDPQTTREDRGADDVERGAGPR